MNFSINFLDIYGAVTTVVVKTSVNIREILKIIDEWLYMLGDQLMDESSFSAARKFRTYLKRLGFNAKISGKMFAGKQLNVRLETASISSMDAADVSEDMISLPVGLHSTKYLEDEILEEEK